ncbi:MAG: NADH-quinone oxidoreductase subunit NuoE [Synergistales bacterium]|nr:NADH-quinone oxidoreductase subunit NuoE [Synergistales bacterium]
MTTSAAEQESGEFDLTILDGIIEEALGEHQGLIPILQNLQDAYGYLPREVLTATAERLNMPYSKIFGVATFYSQFHLTPRGRHIIQQCDGTACHVKGGTRVRKAIEDTLGIKPGETSEDLRFTYEVVYCLGSCGLAPAAMVDDEVVGRLTPEKMKAILESLD